MADLIETALEDHEMRLVIEAVEGLLAATEQQLDMLLNLRRNQPKWFQAATKAAVEQELLTPVQEEILAGDKRTRLESLLATLRADLREQGEQDDPEP